MGLLQEEGVDVVHHYAPLHYLPFIARDRALLSKPSLIAKGYHQSHLRSKSREHDVARGFGNYAFLTLERKPRILMAKLQGGFPHIDIVVPVDAVEKTAYDLCRYNVAMTRYLRRDGSPGFPESAGNGRYYESHQIPVARTDSDKRAQLGAHYNRSMIEVLIHGNLPLPDSTKVQTYSHVDAEVAHEILAELGTPWTVEMVDPPGPYPRSAQHSANIDEFVGKALSDPSWLGNGLEYDKV
jgi:hypothetical protein